MRYRLTVEVESDLPNQQWWEHVYDNVLKRAVLGGMVVWFDGTCTESLDLTTPAICGTGNPEAGDYAGHIEAITQSPRKRGSNEYRRKPED